MSKMLTVFVSKSADIDQLYQHLKDCSGSDTLESLDNSDRQLAIRTVGSRMMHLTFFENSVERIADAFDWDWIDINTRLLLNDSRAISLIFEDDEQAKIVLQNIINFLGDDVRNCVLDNDLGVLLLLEDVKSCIERHPGWTWRKESFPEILGNPHVE